jgi:hypothetical protein
MRRSGGLKEWFVFAVLLLAIGLAPPACAQNPRLDLKLEGVTAAEAVAQLGRAIGAEVELRRQPLPSTGQPPPAPELDEKASFDWRGVSLARALRQLCGRYNLRSYRAPEGGFWLSPLGPATVPALQAPPAVEKNGLRLFVRSVSVFENMSAAFVPGLGEWNGASVYLQLGCQALDGDAEAIAGVDNVTARDDMGNLLVAEQDMGHSYYGASGPYPDEWSGGANLPMPHPRTKKLVWLQGDLMGYPRVKPIRVEIPMPAAGGRTRKQVGNMIFLVSGFEAATDIEVTQESLLPPAEGTQQQQPGFRVRVRIVTPRDSRVTPRFGSYWDLRPLAVGASGKTYRSRSTSQDSSFDDGQVRFYDATCSFAMEEKPASLRWEAVERAEPRKLFSFRLADIPLPVGSGFAPLRPPNPYIQVVTTADEPPATERGGGILLNRILIREQPAGEGTLAVGLAPKDGSEGSRWITLPVGRDGVARLKDLPPGTYRLLRFYRPKEVPAVNAPTPGRWLNNEVTVEIAAGKETSPPPLQWTPEPGEAAPAAPAAAKPAKRPGPRQGQRR